MHTTPVIRAARPEDTGGILEIYGPVILHTHTSFEFEVPSPQAFRQRIAAYQDHAPWLVCTRGGRVAGYAYAGKHRSRQAYQWSVETSAYVHPDFQRRNIGKALYQALLALLRLQGFYNAYAGIALPNPGSIAFHRAIGFEAVGTYRKVGFKQGRWVDVSWWAKNLQAYTTQPEPPRRAEELPQLPVYAGILRQAAGVIRTG